MVVETDQTCRFMFLNTDVDRLQEKNVLDIVSVSQYSSTKKKGGGQNVVFVTRRICTYQNYGMVVLYVDIDIIF